MFLDRPDLLDDDVGGGPLPPDQPGQLLGNGGPGVRGGLAQGHLSNIHQLIPVIADLWRHKLNCGLFCVLKLVLVEIFISFEPPLIFEALWLFATGEGLPVMDVGEIYEWVLRVDNNEGVGVEDELVVELVVVGLLVGILVLPLGRQHGVVAGVVVLVGDEETGAGGGGHGARGHRGHGHHPHRLDHLHHGGLVVVVGGVMEIVRVDELHSGTDIEMLEGWAI